VPRHPHRDGAGVRLRQARAQVKVAAAGQPRPRAQHLLVDELAPDLALERVHIDVRAVHTIGICHSSTFGTYKVVKQSSLPKFRLHQRVWRDARTRGGSPLTAPARHVCGAPPGGDGLHEPQRWVRAVSAAPCPHATPTLSLAAHRVDTAGTSKHTLFRAFAVLADCPAGNFCKVTECDSNEGWPYVCGICMPCAACGCDAHSSSGLCPTERCPGSPFLVRHARAHRWLPALHAPFAQSMHAPTSRVLARAGASYPPASTHSASGRQRLGKLAGTFYSAVRKEKWQGDVCVTKLTVSGSWFWMASFRVAQSLFAMSPAMLPPDVDDNPSLCDFPDALGPVDGKIEQVESTRPDAFATLKFTYVTGLPMGLERIVTLFDDCPNGLIIHFEAIPWVARGYTQTVGVAPPRYSYESGDRMCSRCIYPSSGYRFNQNLASGVVKVAFEGPAGTADHLPGYRRLSGTYTGFFSFGSTRRRSVASYLYQCPLNVEPVLTE